MPIARPTFWSSAPRRAAASGERTLAVGPTGMSMTTCGRAGSGLLRQDRCHQLTLAVEVQRPLDTDQQIVGGTQAHRSAPHDASAFAVDDAAHPRGVERHRRQHFHRVRGTGGRGDRPRRGLGNRQSRRCDDRDDDQGRPVAGQPADAMLVHDHRLRPREPRPHVDHRARQRDRFAGIEPVAGAGGDERGEVQIRILSGDDVAHDLAHRVIVEAMAIDLRPQVGERLDRRRMGHDDRIARRGRPARPTPLPTGPPRRCRGAPGRPC